MYNIALMTAVALFLEFSTMSATQRAVPGTYATIQAAINAASAGDTIAIANGTYSEAVTVNKSVTLLGASSSVVITPSSGIGIAVNANNVRLQSLRVTHGLSNGISVSNVSNITLVNVSSDSNKIHGLSIGSGSSNISISGGTFNANGTTRGTGGDGGGISIYATGGSLISNVSILGSLSANDNSTAGIWMNAATSADTIKTVTIGSGGGVALTNNGGAGVLLLGNVKDATITATCSKGAAFASGVLILGIDFFGASSPVNTIIKRSTFNTGYASDQPAISLSAGVFPYTSVNPVTADSNVFVGAVTQIAINSLIYDQLDDANLGLVTHTNDNALPVELTSFTGTARGRQIELKWSTATEVNNYGFEVERKPLPNPPLLGEGINRGVSLPSPPLTGEGIKGWGRIGFVQGNGTTSRPQSYLYRDEVEAAGKFKYRLKQIDHDGKFEYSVAVEVTSTLAPADYGLSQNYPNPFNPSTKIRFALEKSEFAEVKVFDTIGREVQILFSGFAYSGVLQELSFSPEKPAAGAYFYTLSTNNRHEIKKMLLLK